MKSMRCTSLLKFMIWHDLFFVSFAHLIICTYLYQEQSLVQMKAGPIYLIQSFQLLNSIRLQLTVMKERLYNKQNAYGDSYQMRPKQYSNANLQKEPISYSPKALQNNTNASESPYVRSPKYDHYQQYEVKKTPKYDRNAPAYGRREHEQISDKYDFLQTKTKHRPYQPQQKTNYETFTEHSFGQGSLQVDSTLPQNKRENAKRKGLQIKMSNINCINDKINNLLNMVKKDRIQPSFRDEQISPKRTQSPIPNRINSQSSFQINQSKNLKSGSKQAYEGDYNKSNKKMRTLSGLQEKPNAKQPIRQQYKQKQCNNEEDKYGYIYSKQNYPPSPVPSHHTQNKRRQQGATRYKYEMNNHDGEEVRQMNQQMQRKESKYSPYNQKYLKDNYEQQFNEAVAKRNNRQDKSPTPTRNQKQTGAQNKHSPLRHTFDRSKSNLQNNFMPITLVQQEKVNRPSFGLQPSQQGIKMIDDRLKRIKQKINQSQTQNKKYQQRLDTRQQNNYVGKIYTNEANNNFQLKVHPVVNDKPHTVKIAQKLAYQIEVDGRISKARQEFDRIEDEDKWRDLELKLSKNGVRLTQIQIKELLTISPNQFTPFDRDQTNQNADLARGFCEAQKHWQKQVTGCAMMKSLKSQGFNINQLDLNKKGYLSIQDIVCFVNLYTGHFHKNRDLAIIYRRLQLLQRNKDDSGIDFSTFYRAFTI